MTTPLPPEHQQRVAEHLVHEWARAIDENRVEAICELLAPDGRYTVQSRFNADRGLPHALIDAHGAAQLRDRILSMRQANIYEPQHYRHIVSGVQVLGGQGTQIEVRSNFLVIRTMDLDGTMMVFACGQSQDCIELAGDAPRFVRRHHLIDSRAVETLMVIPL